ncbi:hypothetical protein EYF80_049029 [Liparis tanakae]|uniref:Uncharacterized protein n=1 Tax=Liparis tanakae TaxID=230148 RepID=A0A4Z2FHX3_9TELE|nr:hypothetical protein EYF80_049029 [Liparis tanakae]
MSQVKLLPPQRVSNVGLQNESGREGTVLTSSDAERRHCTAACFFISSRLRSFYLEVEKAHLVLQVIVVAVVQEKAEDVAGVNHGIDPALLKLLAKPALHWAQRLEQGHLRGRQGAHGGVGAREGFRRSGTV